MGVRGELYTTEVYLDNRSYFFNVKENRTGDVFLQVVESKSRDGSDTDRHQIAIFADDLQKFLKGLDLSLAFIEKDKKSRAKAKALKKAEKQKKYVVHKSDERAISEPQVKKTGRIHVISKRNKETTENKTE